jgi:anti-sigma regulatory factor (Ser/Thr protein kinase)
MVREWGLGELSDNLELVVSELMTNSVRASVGLAGSWHDGRWRSGVPPVRLWICSDEKSVLVQVWDGDDRMPARRDVGPDAESGRGLLLVEALSAAWGMFVPEGRGGKTIWSIVERP